MMTFTSQVWYEVEEDVTTNKLAGAHIQGEGTLN